MGAALAARAAEQAGPAPSDIIYPHGGATSAASAATDSSAVKALAPAAPSIGGMGPAVGYVVLLLLLVAGAFYLIKRGSLPRPFAKSEGKLRVLETRMLGNRQFLVVVEYEEAKMLVGVCPGRIDYLTPLAGHPLAAAAASIEEEEREAAR
jgi:flagellar protein FliO/FliZ